MTAKIAFGVTNFLKGAFSSGIDGIGHYCYELLTRLSTTQNYHVTPYSFGYEGNGSDCFLLPKYPNYLIKSSLGLANSYKFFDRFDVIHATDQLMPIKTVCPIVSTVMDVIPLSHPELTPSRFALLKAKVWRRLTKNSSHIITISEYSKSQVIKYFDYPEDQITAIPLGVDKRFFVKLDENLIESVKSKFNLPKNFFLLLGTIQPRKNIVKTLEAHSKLPFNYAKEFPIVLAGRYGWGDEVQLNAIKKAVSENRCIWIDYVSDIEKRALLQSALALTFASLYEGFGLPILEAFASKLPVITSANSSMIELAKNSAILVDPEKTEEIKLAMLAIIDDSEMTKRLILKGLERASLFSWDETSRATASVYAKLK